VIHIPMTRFFRFTAAHSSLKDLENRLAEGLSRSHGRADSRSTTGASEEQVFSAPRKFLEHRADNLSYGFVVAWPDAIVSFYDNQIDTRKPVVSPGVV
jgi:hypothetical protein